MEAVELDVVELEEDDFESQFHMID